MAKSKKTWHPVINHFNVRELAVEAAENMQSAVDLLTQARASVAECMLTYASAFANKFRATDAETQKNGYETLAHYYAEARVNQGISVKTADKEASNMRAMCRAALGGDRVVEKIKGFLEAPLHEVVAKARELTPAKFLPGGKQRKAGSGGVKKTSVTAKQFAIILKWIPLFSESQRKRALAALTLTGMPKGRSDKAAATELTKRMRVIRKKPEQQPAQQEQQVVAAAA